MSAHCLTGRLLVHREIACSVAAAQPPKKYPILLAKSLQGDKIKLYYIVWLSEIRLLSYRCPDWRHDASRFSRMSSAPSNSPADPPRAGAHHRREKVRAAPRPSFSQQYPEVFGTHLLRLMTGDQSLPETKLLIWRRF